MRPVLFVAPPRGVHGVVAAAFLLGNVVSVQAQSTVALPAIDVVSASLIPTPADQTASSVTVITAADIEREQRRTVPDLLQTVPGLNVVQSGGPGGTTAVFMRGMNANHVKVLMDGIDVGDLTTPNGAFDFAHLLTGDIERIEVLRGPQSGLYGSDAMGGVISITTKRGEGPPKATGMIEGGSFGTFNQTAGVSGSQGNFDYAFNVLHFRSDNTPVMPLNLVPPGGQRINNSYNNWTYATNLGAKLTDDLSVRLIGRYTQAKLGLSGIDFVNFFPGPPMAEALPDTQANHNAYTRAEAVWTPSAGFKNVFGVSYVNLWNRSVDPNPDSGFTSPLVSPPITNLGQRTKFDWHGEAKVAPGQTVVLGLEHQRETLRTDSTGTTDPFFNFTQTTTSAKTGNKAGFIELQSEFEKRFYIVSNLRYDDNENFGGHTTWRVAPAFIAPVTETKLKASYGTGFKAPTLNQLFSSFPPFFISNPDLKPEKSVGYDAGFEQPFWNDRVRVGATYFHNDVTDLIQSVTIDPTVPLSTLENVQKAKTQGWEMFGAATVTDRFKVRTDYTFTRAIDTTTGLDLLRRPRRKNSVTAIWTPVDKLSLSATLLHVGVWSDIDRQLSTTIQQDGYTLVNLAANYAVDEHLAVFGRIDNALNRQYQDPNGFLRPGFGIYGGMRVSN